MKFKEGVRTSGIRPELLAALIDSCKLNAQKKPEVKLNIYLITQGGQADCYQATCMQEAVNIAEREYLDEIIEFHKENMTEFVHNDELQHWQECVLESCNLIGELKNPSND